MKNLFLRFFEKLAFHFNYRCFVKQWVIGITRGNITDVIRNKTFDPDITWVPTSTLHQQQADPFILNANNGTYSVLIEDYKIEDQYGKIALMVFDEKFKKLSHETVLDSGSHLSYPFIFRENDKIYVFPEAGKSGKLTCYEYDSLSRSLTYLEDIIELPLLDSNIIKYDHKYWVFGVIKINGIEESYELHCFYSTNLLGPYIPHKANPLQTGLDGVRGAGDFFEVDKVLYRPTQNCKEEYGKSITINKISLLSEVEYNSEFYMSVLVNKKNRNNKKMQSIHTINILNGIIAVDGIKKTFAPLAQYKEIKMEKKRLASPTIKV